MENSTYSLKSLNSSTMVDDGIGEIYGRSVKRQWFKQNEHEFMSERHVPSEEDWGSSMMRKSVVHIIALECGRVCVTKSSIASYGWEEFPSHALAGVNFMVTRSQILSQPKKSICPCNTNLNSIICVWISTPQHQKVLYTKNFDAR